MIHGRFPFRSDAPSNGRAVIPERRHRFGVAAVAAGALLASLSIATAAEPTTKEQPKDKDDEQLIDELFVGEKIYVQDKGEFVLVVTPSFTEAKDGKEGELSTEVKYGVTDRLQLSAEVPFSLVDPDIGHQHEGLSDIGVAANYNFFQSDKFDAGLRTEFLLPTGSERRGLGGGEFVWSPSLLTSARIGRGEVYAGVGGEFGENHDAFTYSIAGAYPWLNFVGVLELTGSTGNGQDPLYLAPGIYWHPKDHVELGFGVPVGLTHDSDDYRLVAKLVFEF